MAGGNIVDGLPPRSPRTCEEAKATKAQQVGKGLVWEGTGGSIEERSPLSKRKNQLTRRGGTWMRRGGGRHCGVGRPHGHQEEFLHLSKQTQERSNIKYHFSI